MYIVSTVYYLLFCSYRVRRVNKELASVVTLDDMLAFVGKADMSGDDVKKCLAEFDS